ncbi:MAG: hypothetical protein Ct9H90mP9_1050 [Pseudomonadota bacterium]|nr:MAG: hypothetical protein Ct9H90mP9_1050 [Pseudomonadota bacterium]
MEESPLRSIQFFLQKQKKQQKYQPHRWSGQPDGQVDTHDNRKMDRMHPQISEDWSQNRSKDDDGGTCIKETSQQQREEG